MALSAVPRRELGHASGLFNFTRTVGGSIGIAAVATMLERGSQVHQSRLAAHVSLYDPEVWERYQTLVGLYATRGADPATAEQQAWAHLYEMVQREALALSFIDNFWRLVWIFAAVIPFVLFLRRGPRTGRQPGRGGAGRRDRRGLRRWWGAPRSDRIGATMAPNDRAPPGAILGARPHPGAGGPHLRPAARRLGRPRDQDRDAGRALGRRHGRQSPRVRLPEPAPQQAER